MRQATAQTPPDLIASYRAETSAFDALTGDGLAKEPTTASEPR